MFHVPTSYSCNICDIIRVHVYHMAAGWLAWHSYIYMPVKSVGALVVYYVHIYIDR
jgi:hypothetical protein